MSSIAVTVNGGRTTHDLALLGPKRFCLNGASCVHSR